MESWQIYGFSAIILFFGGVIGGLIAGLVSDVLRARDVASLQARVKRLELMLISADGNQARAQKNERQAEAIGRALALFGEGKKPEEIVKLVGVEYPDVAANMIMQAVKGKMGGGLGQLMKGLV